MENRKRGSNNSPIKFIANWLLFFAITAGGLYITSIVFNIFLTGSAEFIKLGEELRKVSITIIHFLKPFIILTIILVIVEWILREFGIELTESIRVLIKKVSTKKI